MTKLTPQQRQLIEYILRTHARTGVFPSVREIAHHMRFKSTNTVDYHVRQLEKLGVIERMRGRHARAFNVREKAKPKLYAMGLRAGDNEIPVVGRVAAGEPIYAEQNFEGMLNFRNHFKCDERTFALRVAGESMIKAGIHDGDIVVVKQQNKVENGEIGVAVIGDEATVKRIHDDGEKWRLVPENPTMQPIIVEKSEKSFAIAGRVIGVIRKL